MNLILFGFKGCGKTHFGKLLALKMHRKFLDTDDLLAELYALKTGQRIGPREIYMQIGAEGFRALEKEAIRSLKTVKEAIIALGGGAVLDLENIELLQKIGCLVYLCASPKTLQTRIPKEKPPAFMNGVSFLEVFQERKPIYESIPAARIDVDALDEAGVLAALRSILILEDPPNGF